MKYKIVKNFLSEEQNKELLERTLNHKGWKDSTIINNANNYRKSKVIYYLDNDVITLFEGKIKDVYRDVLSELDMEDFDISKIEMQMTSSNNGDFFKVHPDADYKRGRGDVKKRKLTFVYYYFNEPKPFTGGDLKIYDFKDDNRTTHDASKFETIVPENNMLIFFQSDYWHEVEKVFCEPSFENSRFTVNSWIQ
jgi:SM-20-related protein